MKNQFQNSKRALRRVRLQAHVRWMLLIGAWGFGVNPLIDSGFVDYQDIYSTADFFRIIFRSNINEPSSVTSPTLFHVVPVSVVIRHHGGVIPKEINHITKCYTAFSDRVNAIFHLSFKLQVAFVYFQSIILNASKEYLQSDSILSVKLFTEFDWISIPDRHQGFWQRRFQNFYRLFKINCHAIFRRISSINDFVKIEFGYRVENKASRAIEYVMNWPYFANRNRVSRVVVLESFAIGSYNNSTFYFYDDDSSLSDSSLTKKTNDEKSYKKPKYIRLTDRGHIIEAVLEQGYPTYGFEDFDVDVSIDECKTWFSSFDDNCLNGLPNYFSFMDSSNLVYAAPYRLYSARCVA